MDERITAPCNWVTIAQRSLAMAEGMPDGEEKRKRIDIGIHYLKLAYDFLIEQRYISARNSVKIEK